MAALLAVVVAPLAQAQLAQGDVDPDFTYVRPATEPPDSTNAVPLPNGYLLVRARVAKAPVVESTLALTLLDNDGRIVDQGFGTDGTYTNSLPGAVDLAIATTRLADGSLLLGGYKLKDGSTTDSIAAIARVDGSGQLDPAFGQAGVATIDAPGGRDRVAAVAALPDGRIATLVWSEAGPNYYDCSADRLALYYSSPDGSDTRLVMVKDRDSFATDSCRTTATLHVDPDGTVLVGTEIGIFRTDGVTTGDSLLPLNWRYGPFAKDPQLGMVGTTISGRTVHPFAGKLPDGDGLDGLVEAAGYSAPVTWSKLVIDAAHLVVYVAFATDCGQVGVARFSADGRLDTGWGGGDGVVAIAGSGSPPCDWLSHGLATEARLLHVDSDGDLVVATADGFLQRLVGGDAPQFRAFTLSGSDGSVPEAATWVSVVVRRVGGSEGAASATVTTAACGTARGRECSTQWSAAEPDVDYRSMTQRLDWDDGDETDRVVRVDLLDDSVAEGNEQFFIEISEVTNGYRVLVKRVPIRIEASDLTEPGRASRGGSGGVESPALLLLLAAALRRLQQRAIGRRDSLTARNGR